jgi:proliferating cell nuclear antigen
MEIKIDNAKYFGECVRAIAPLVDEANLKFSKEGLSVLSLDRTSVALVDFNLPSKAFSKYEVENESIGINIENFNKIISRARDGESLTINKSKDAKTKITAIFAIGNSKRKYLINMIDVKETKDVVPKVDAKIDIIGSELSNELNDAVSISDFVTLSLSKSGFEVYAKGNIAEMQNECNPDKISEKEAKGTFNLEYLRAMIKGCDKDSMVNLTLANKEPLSIAYDIGEARLRFVLAPYIMEE